LRPEKERTNAIIEHNKGGFVFASATEIPVVSSRALATTRVSDDDDAKHIASLHLFLFELPRRGIRGFVASSRARRKTC
jgi:hypothetical protein